ncbi:NAD(P)H-dependent oxidoreductase [Streptomyces sp. NPDC101169]|uniref:NAD(P)H-dependent oxidoreductase n=1 Tax=Streptomyces sp. NPDC101169 TaxID=3366121 RepID=UPI00382F3933
MAVILTISGSPAESSAAARLLSSHAVPRLVTQGHDVVHLALRDLPPAPLLAQDADHPRLRQAAGLLAGADGVVVATPVYKAAYSGLLKAFLDAMPRSGLAGKHVLQLVVGHDPAQGHPTHQALETVLLSMGARGRPDRCFLTGSAAREPSGPRHTDAIRRLDHALDRFGAHWRVPAGRGAA